ncbi:hypothetical protein [Spirosoma sp. 209]|uniref:hypothetical protein n=1 Tax=Spirosoma sp. 209 TaxID=1955701 RepID=UPI00098D1E17|nr:hypothetical protein [Spirosoma sp. 209]
MRFLRYAVLVTAGIFWLCGLSATVSHWLYEAGVIADDYRYGDLYRLSALPQFKQEQPTCTPSNRDSDTASTHLYIIGDSFSEPQRITKDDFRVSHYQRVHWYNKQRAQLDTSKRNVLLIETIERHFRDHVTQPVRELVVDADTNQSRLPPPTGWERVKTDIHWSDVEQRLETALFSHQWAFWFKELKATLTLRWFDRSNEGVSLSRNRQHIFLNSDTDTSSVLSSYSPLTSAQVDAYVDSLNATADYYKQQGFDAVYLSIIPNKASILEPNRYAYNHLIERIQQHPKLAVPTIDVYSPFSQAPASPYLKSDTHWDCEGRAIWLRLVREKIGI